MIHLKTMFENEVNWEAGKNKHIAAPEPATPRKNIRLACMVGGFWFCLTYLQWSKYRGIQYSTLLARRHVRKNADEILEFTAWRYKPALRVARIECVFGSDSDNLCFRIQRGTPL